MVGTISFANFAANLVRQSLTTGMKHTFRHYLLRYKYVISIAVFVVFIGFVGDHCLIRRISQRNEIQELKHEISTQKKTYNKDKNELNKIKNNPEAVKRVAHEKYYMKSEDEDIFVIDESE